MAQGAGGPLFVFPTGQGEMWDLGRPHGGKNKKAWQKYVKFTRTLPKARRRGGTRGREGAGREGKLEVFPCLREQKKKEGRVRIFDPTPTPKKKGKRKAAEGEET